MIIAVYCPIQKSEAQSLTPPEFDLHDGPFVQKLNETLKQCGVEHQAYHGGTFVGVCNQPHYQTAL